MANFLTQAISSLGGSKMSDPRRLHDPKELKKWKDRSEKSYSRYGKRRDYYEGRAGDEYDRYGKSRAEAERMFGKSEAATSAAGSGLTSAALRERRAGELADDRQHYAGLAERRRGRDKQRDAYRLELESMGAPPPGSFDAVQSMVMDAAKMSNEAAMVQTQAIAANLGKTNPVAAAKMLTDAQDQASMSLSKAKQKGWFAGKENFFKEMGMNINNVTARMNILGDEEASDQLSNAMHSQRINEQLNIAGSALNRTQGQLAQADRYGDIGSQHAGLAGMSLGASQSYDQFGDAISDNITSMEEQEKGYQRDLLQSDAIAQAQADEYNAGRFGRGLKTGMELVRTGAELYSGFKTGQALTEQAGLYSNQGAPPSVNTFVDKDMPQGSPRLISDRSVTGTSTPAFQSNFAGRRSYIGNQANLQGLSTGRANAMPTWMNTGPGSMHEPLGTGQTTHWNNYSSSGGEQFGDTSPFRPDQGRSMRFATRSRRNIRNEAKQRFRDNPSGY